MQEFGIKMNAINQEVLAINMKFMIIDELKKHFGKLDNGLSSIRKQFDGNMEMQKLEITRLENNLAEK